MVQVAQVAQEVQAVRVVQVVQVVKRCMCCKWFLSELGVNFPPPPGKARLPRLTRTFLVGYRTSFAPSLYCYYCYYHHHDDDYLVLVHLDGSTQ